MDSEAPLRVLSLDGGGIRGISSLLILEDIMEKLCDALTLDSIPRPCDFFDLIGGTSTGGIIAIMLGRLGMTVDECIQAYKEVAQQAFTPKRTAFVPRLPASPAGAFSAKALEAAIKKMVRKFCAESECAARRNRGLSTTETCPHSDVGYRHRSCTKTVVLAITKDNVDAGPTLFATYDTSAGFDGCTIWQVARMTSAATTFFKPITIGRDGIEFVDAGFGYNNPCEVLIEEARRQFPGRGRLQVLSIGTGLGDVVSIGDTRLSILKALKRMASSSKAVAARLDGQYGDSGQYYRFNVDQGLNDITLSDWEKSSTISAHTHNYLKERQRTIKKYVDSLAGIIPNSGAPVGRTALVISGAVEAGEDKAQDMAATLPRGVQRPEAQLGGASTGVKTDQISDINRKIVLSMLPVAKGAAFHAHENEHDPSCHPNTRVDLLAHVHTWIQDPNGKCIFWLRGMAGTGKSTISRTVAKKLSEAKVPNASFFFKKGEGDRGRAAMFFTTVLAQLVVQLPELAPHLQSAIENDPAIVDKSKPEQFEKLLLEPLDKCKTSSSLLAVVVDALDECDREEDARALIYLLSRAKEATSCRLRFFVTSRPELPIRLGFKEICGNYQHLALHDIPKQDITRDIATYLRSELAHILQNFNKTVTGPGLPPNWPPPASLRSLVNMAVPLFIFASTACRFIDDVAYGNPMEQLDKILENQKKGGWSQLHMTYLPILNQLLLKRTDSGSVRRAESEAAEIVAWFRDIVGTIVLLADPLPSASLARVLRRSQLDVDSKLRGLHSVLDISEDPLVPVKLLHLSFRDFLVNLQNRDANPFWVDERETHKQLADRCLNLLSTGDTLKRDICSLRWPGTTRYEIDPQVISAALPPEIQYACRYWVYHWKKSRRKIRDSDLVSDFLARYLMCWLEALGIIGRIRESIGMVDDLLRLLHPTESAAVAELLRDMRRLILGFGSVIDVSPLQVHCSALVFAPEGSVIRNKYHDHFPTWLSLMPQMEPDWDACLQTLEGHSDSVNSVAFSGDSRQLASASSDKTIKLWDTATGQCMATLEGHSDSVNSVAFSGNSRQLASASHDCTVKLWDAATEQCVATLEGHGGYVHSVTFSGDSRQVASASWGRTVKLWDAATRQCLQTFNVNKAIYTVSFDAAGSCLYTNAGRILLSKPSATTPTSIQASSQQPHIQGYGVSADKAWITCSGQNLLWLPKEYRTSGSAVSGSTVALGCSSGRVLVLRFSGEDVFSRDSRDRGGM